ncbi:hypothetical protein EIN43_06130 [Enterobacter hormaechei]|uniref:Uncharacterized protein n=1 Tax=Enterobacter hormaechei TaxID=158836 RepID=A0A4Y5ZQV1_9ENTR|nr:hypothetical protein EIN43_06130 [Enterobacter hormaechei]
MGFDGLAESVAESRKAASKEYTQLTAEYNKHIANLSKSQWQWEEEAKNGSGGVKGTGSVDRQTKDAVSKLAQDSDKRPKRRKPLWKLAIAPENYRARARTLTETLETLRQTGETHAKTPSSVNSNLDSLNWMRQPKPARLLLRKNLYCRAVRRF